MEKHQTAEKSPDLPPQTAGTQTRFKSIEEYKRVLFPDAFARENEADDSGSAIGEQLAEQSKHVVRAAFAVA